MGFHLSDAATATEVAQTQVVSRANEMIDGVIEPVVTALEDTYAFLSTVEFSAEYVRSHEAFLTKLLVEFVQQWELAAYQDYVAEGEVSDEAFAKSRVITRPSWEALREWGSVRLSVEDALTMVAAGVTLGLWEAWPDPSQVRQFPEVDEQYMPFLIPTEALLGVSAA